MKENGALGHLSEGQRAQVWDWVQKGKSYREIEEISAKPEPEGLGVEASHSAIGRFVTAERKRRFLVETEEESKMAAELLEAAELGTVDFSKATKQVLHRKVFHAALEAKGDSACEMLRKLTEMEQRGQRIQLAARGHDLAKLRFEFNSAREVLKKTSVYVKLYQQPAMDNEAKVWEARRICFGSGAGHMEGGGPKLIATESTEITKELGETTADDADGKSEPVN